AMSIPVAKADNASDDHAFVRSAGPDALAVSDEQADSIESDRVATDRVHYVMYSVIGWMESGEYCLVTRYRSATSGPTQSATAAYLTSFAAANGGSKLPACPPEPLALVQPGLDAVYRFWRVENLARPIVSTHPDYAVTGRPLYLEIGGPSE